MAKFRGRIRALNCDHILVRLEGWNGSLSYFWLAYFWLARVAHGPSRSCNIHNQKHDLAADSLQIAQNLPYQLNLRLSRIDLSNEKAGLTKFVGSP
jgi:hypothetical protein